jgi:uncharacterized protein (DUF433 family)
MDIEIEPSIPVPLVKWEDGSIRVKETRVLLEIIISAFQSGDTPEHIVQSYTSLKLADVYAVLAYYLTHRQDIDRYVQWVEEESARIQQEIEERFPRDPNLKAKLLARLEEKRKQQAEQP